MKAIICVPTNMQPFFFKLRPLPYSLKDSREIAQLSTTSRHNFLIGIPISSSLMVESRYVGYTMLLLNAVSKLDSYSLPRVEDLFTAMFGLREVIYLTRSLPC